MKFTRFIKLKRAIEALDPNIIRKKLGALEHQLKTKGLPLDPKNTAFTQEGIYYVDPNSGIATKVILYAQDYVTNLSKAQRKALKPQGYKDEGSLRRFDNYHLMYCNALADAIKANPHVSYRINRRLDAKFYYRIVSEPDPKTGKREVYQELNDQRLLVCRACLLKATSIVEGLEEENQQTFDLKKFFDVGSVKSWNSRGMLSKDVGFTTGWHPQDWEEICTIRKEQLDYQCECCGEDLSNPHLQKFLYIKPTDHVMGKAGYFRLECLCIACLIDNGHTQDDDGKDEHQQFLRLRDQVRARVKAQRESV